MNELEPRQVWEILDYQSADELSADREEVRLPLYSQNVLLKQDVSYERIHQSSQRASANLTDL